MKSHLELIESLVERGVLKTPRIIAAFKRVDRARFVPPGFTSEAYVDAPLPIGDGQTISQPYTVAFMLELLSPRIYENIMDIGSGSGWTTALLAEIVGEDGYVVAIERLSALCAMTKKNVSTMGYTNVEYICGDGSHGYAKMAPYDRILAGASGRDIPEAWKKQLKVGGALVTPIETSIWRVVKTTEDTFKEEEYPGFVFVPLIKET